MPYGFKKRIPILRYTDQDSNLTTGRPAVYNFEINNNVGMTCNPDLYFRKGDSIIQCVEESLMGCKDPTPSNLVHGLLR